MDYLFGKSEAAITLEKMVKTKGTIRKVTTFLHEYNELINLLAAKIDDKKSRRILIDSIYYYFSKDLARKSWGDEETSSYLKNVMTAKRRKALIL